MAVLLVDIGNTRIKWARLDGRRLGRSQAAPHSRSSSYGPLAKLLRAGSLDAVLISSVAGPEASRPLVQAAKRAKVPVRYVRVSRQEGGVRVGYLEPWRLGVDRFVACVGAHQLFPGVPVLIVGVGTAMTIDLLDARGSHRGGVIIPSPALMIETLFTKTRGIRRRSQGGAPGGGGFFGRSTRAGVVSGSRFAAAALIDRAADEAQQVLRRRPLVLIHGGDAPAVRALVVTACVGVPDLVLRGLAVLSQARKPRRVP